MNINVPRVGSMQFMAQDIATRLGLGYVETPRYSERTIDLGVRLAPELVCFPMKVLLGSAIESLEAGADTLITIAGYGPCRFNYWAEIQERILKREGYDFRMLIFDSPRDSLREFVRNVRALLPTSRGGYLTLVKAMRLGISKGHGYDEIEKQANALRALERERGSVDRVAAGCVELLEAAYTASEIEEARAEAARRFAAVVVDDGKPFLRVGVTGEIMMAIEPYFNYDITRWLAENGAVVERSIYMSDLFTLGGKNPVSGPDHERICSSALPYVASEIGGHGQINVAACAEYARRGFDAVVHFFPFTCLPEVIAKTVFTRLSEDFGMPVLSISIDEQTGKAGMRTRLEALMDLAWSTKGQRAFALGDQGTRVPAGRPGLSRATPRMP